MKKFITVFSQILLVLAVLCVPAGATVKTIEVSNAWEFLEALGSDRIIEMDYSGNYSLSDWDPYFTETDGGPKLTEGVSWSEAYDGGELVLSGIRNLTIRCEGAEGSKADIVIDPRYSFVMRFENCSDIVIEGVSAGHTVGGYCEGGVFSFTDSSRITISNTRMFGCGTEGLVLANVSDMKVNKYSGIYDCTYYIMTVSGGENIAFEECMFFDNKEFSLVNVDGTRNLSFTQCFFNDNEGQMFNVNDTTVSVSDSSFNRNVTDEPIDGSRNVKFTNCDFD